jgi:hypothetical protein
MQRAIPDIDGLKFSFWSNANDDPSMYTYLILNKLYNLQARGVEPLFPPCMSSNVRGWFTSVISEANTL